MSVLRSDVMLLEAYMRGASRRMPTKIMDPYANLNTPYDNPVLITWGSNSMVCGRDDLEPLLDVLDADNEISPNGFLEHYWKPFLRKFADTAPVSNHKGYGGHR